MCSNVGKVWRKIDPLGSSIKKWSDETREKHWGKLGFQGLRSPSGELLGTDSKHGTEYSKANAGKLKAKNDAHEAARIAEMNKSVAPQAVPNNSGLIIR